MRKHDAQALNSPASQSQNENLHAHWPNDCVIYIFLTVLYPYKTEANKETLGAEKGRISLKESGFELTGKQAQYGERCKTIG